jgi:Bifunctional DNA primase/polymerase, N-terminal
MTASLLDIANSYISLGWSPVPIPYKKKRPEGEHATSWPSLRIDAETAPNYFNGQAGNIGVLLGAASGGLTDVDLDCVEAARAACHFLRPTHIFGRPGNPRSHWLYETQLAETIEKATIQFKDGDKVLLEVRIGGGGSGAQTVFPGSTHPSGELIAWDDSQAVEKADGADLLTRCKRVAAVSLLARYYPKEGSLARHNAGLVIGGFLARCGFDPQNAWLFADAVCAISEQTRDKRQDITRACKESVEAFIKGKPAAGRTKLHEMFGPEVAKKCCEWLGYQAGSDPTNVIHVGDAFARIAAAGAGAADLLSELFRGKKSGDPVSEELLIKAAAKQTGVGVRAIQQKLKKQRAAEAENAEVVEGPSDGRPVIKLVENEITRIVNEIEAAVILANCGLYQRGGLLVRIEDRKFLGFEEKEIISAAIVQQCEHTLQEDADAAAHFLKYAKRDKKWVSADPTIAYIKVWAGRGGRSRLPILSGPISSPLILPSGRIVETPGFDPPTGFFFNPLGIVFDPVPTKPTRQAALDAVDLLDQLLRDFPFADDAGVSHSVALAGLLTSVMRRAVGLAPMFAISAPLFGSGKSYLVNIFCGLATGRAAPVITPGKTEKEFETRLDALLLEGVGFVAIDNVEPAQLGVQALATTLSEKEKKCRVLGESKMPVCSTDVFVSCTGNNLEISQDLRRRTLLCELKPKEERPWTRNFDADPVEMLSRERGRFVIACLTIIQAYRASGEKAMVINEAGVAVAPVPYANYGVWSRMIREPLLWLGLADPLASQVTTEDLDPYRDEIYSLALEWEALFGGDPKASAEIVARAEHRYTEEPRLLKNPGFSAALMTVAGIKGTIDSGKLSHWLRRVRGQVVDGYSFERVENKYSNVKKKKGFWKLKGANPKT